MRFIRASFSNCAFNTAFAACSVPRSISIHNKARITRSGITCLVRPTLQTFSLKRAWAVHWTVNIYEFKMATVSTPMVYINGSLTIYICDVCSFLHSFKTSALGQTILYHTVCTLVMVLIFYSLFDNLGLVLCI